ncbi:ORF50 [Lymantria xylina nucleopolyhedrovirus]|uniref:ORF50 n=1 Tax=Lymantria xylina multiple nucleopolyhedrovirus TaxID=2847840 RepID=D4N287_9ABAC|nr:ORF50 [Lymantria xylina nucleopolyhedrovirus]ADD73759.1 ORF50 [Lymantria xylina nucleopolyhedrovirus]
MELIKPFVKYSRAYRTCGDSTAKNKILHDWVKEVGGCQRSDADRQSNFFCDFCQALCDEIAICACRHCFFPRCTSRLEQELTTYALLSVCYWELQESERRSPNVRTVWLERIKFMWITHEDPDKVYRFNATRSDNELVCVQCQHPIDYRVYKHFESKSHNSFNVNLFCPHCLFPIFDICYR